MIFRTFKKIVLLSITLVVVTVVKLYFTFAEEVLEGTKALWFSPNGTKLVFATMNDTKVRNVTFWKYGDPSSLDSQYVKPVVIKYPKVTS